jgi:hypothetical protein
MRRSLTHPIRCALEPDAAGLRHSVISRLAGDAMPGDEAGVTARYTRSLPDDLERAWGLFDANLRES